MILKIFIVKNFSKVKNFKIKNSYFLWKRLHISSTKEQLHLGFYRHVAFSGVKWRNVTPNILWHNVAKCGCLCNIKSSPLTPTSRHVVVKSQMKLFHTSNSNTYII